MSQENVELMRQATEDLRAGRVSAGVEAVDPDVEWDISAYPLPDFPNQGSGRDALVKHMVDYVAGWNDYEATIDELVDAGDDVVLILHERARMRASDVTLARNLTTVWTVRDGRSVRYRVFKTREQALEAVGLAG